MGKPACRPPLPSHEGDDLQGSIEPWAEREILTRAVAAAAREIADLPDELADRRVERCDQAIAVHPTGRLGPPDVVGDRLEELRDAAAALEAGHPAAIADARAGLDAYLQATAIVFRSAHQLAAARAEVWALSALFGVSDRLQGERQAVEISPAVRQELLHPATGSAARSGESLGAAAHRLRHAAAVLEDSASEGSRSSAEERAHAITVIRSHLGPPCRAVVEALEATIAMLADASADEA